jgi:putative ABC transport system substrate-binding protein
MPVVEEAAKRGGMEVVKTPANEAGDLEAAFRQLEAARVDAVIVVDNPAFHGFREAIVAAAAKHRLPTVHGNPEYSDLGGLLYYGTDLAESCRQAARLVAKILRGAKPADLPVEQPLRFQLFVNLKTARSLGITIPQIVLLRADRVIE